MLNNLVDVSDIYVYFLFGGGGEGEGGEVPGKKGLLVFENAKAGFSLGGGGGPQRPKGFLEGGGLANLIFRGLSTKQTSRSVLRNSPHTSPNFTRVCRP